MISYDAIKSEVIARLGNRTDISSRTERWINHALFELLLNPRFGFYQLDTDVIFTTDGTSTQYTFETPLDVWFILDVRDATNQRKIRRTHYNLIDRIQSATGDPFRYYRYGDSIIFDPVARAGIDIVIRFRSRPLDFSSGSNILNLGTEWEEPIIELATIKGFTALSQPEKAAPHKEILEVMLAARMDVPTLDAGDDENTMGPTLVPFGNF